MEGWTWASLAGWEEGAEGLDPPELDELAARAAAEAGAPALAFSVHDSDSVYVVGADARGARFRLVINETAWDSDLGEVPQEVNAAAAWAADYAARAPDPAELQAVLDRQFVFAEEGFDVLLARMGLLPPTAATGAEEIDDEWAPHPDVWDSLEPVASPKERGLERGRWHALLRTGDVTGSLIGAEEEIAQIPVLAVSGYIARPDEPIVFVGQRPTKEELRVDLLSQGVDVGEWSPVPEGVARDLASTAAWALARIS